MQYICTVIFGGYEQGGDGATLVGEVDLHFTIVELKQLYFLWLRISQCHGIGIHILCKESGGRKEERESQPFLMRGERRVSY